ncbi:peptidoglycan-associated lipoprotein [Oleidesulfovibrio alaskensis G20]|jgi:peptidoglycan-associated lipoprotein|uniref:Peptidoglycan-associated lipoprotein n=1 Tax=Oleidesulfovibrio alaskensis (strain ATCC BAA-1058 / DSM 17464 / G20) TaxID=207559 RepID=Q30V70_OLEA2|nr:peptidoglycan-associated lipoprotein Pal [Oleidesulfovibrio alaskensis]ABB40426.1 peptidoglycan-associated lipoprotein [Oleidesulfovibrio alaskensis G20]MBG0772690.1 peptidoglycan-associated lipoprotein Pal [Oleidesulfovibrio alaskensis]MBL3581879.1 peptidoglycan-associated lipoprotein Pal [Oleidesulfovibrio alaskensis]
MRNVNRLGLALILALALTTGFGCAKKQVAATPEKAATETVVVSEDSSSSSSAMSEEALAAYEKAKAVVTGNVVYFEFDKFDLKAEGKELLKGKAEALKAYPQLRVLIEGNCDERGTQEYNLALGERRARAAFEYLVLLGVRPDQLEIVSYGEERPAVSGNNEAAWAKNRRAEFKLIK